MEALSENPKAWSEGRWNDIAYLNPQLINRYCYVANNPVRYNDPSGHAIPLIVIGIGTLAGGVLNGYSEYSKGSSWDRIALTGAKGAAAGAAGSIAGMLLVAQLPTMVATGFAAGAVGGASSGFASRLSLNLVDVATGEPGINPGDGLVESVMFGGVLGGVGGFKANMNLQAAGALRRPWVRMKGIDEWVHGKRPTPADVEQVQTEAYQNALGVGVGVTVDRDQDATRVRSGGDTQLYYAAP